MLIETEVDTIGCFGQCCGGFGKGEKPLSFAAMNRSRSPNANVTTIAWGPLARTQGLSAARPSRSLPEAGNPQGGLRQRPYQVTRLVRSLNEWSSPRPLSGGSRGGGADDSRVRQMRLEAVLLLAKGPLSAHKLSQLAHLADATEARTLIRQLNRIYDDFGRAIRVEQVAGGFRMLTRPALAPWLTRLGHLPPPIRLSTPMMETLAVVAYRQPVSRANAEAVRGVACGELLRQLMERDLIRIVGRSEELGRPYLYGTTKRFLQLFGLPHAEALPPIEWPTLHEDAIQEDSPLDDLSTSTKEPVVSISVAPVLNETEPNAIGWVAPLATQSESPLDPSSPKAEIEDDEEFFDDEDDQDDDDEEEEDWDEDDEDEDWDDDDLEGEEEEVEEEEDAWEEVDDEDADLEEDEEESDEESDEEDEDEDWDDEDDEEEDWEEEDEEDDDWD